MTITVKDAARILGCTEQYIRVGIRTGQLPIGAAVKVGGSRYTYRIYLSKVAGFLGVPEEEVWK